MRFFMDLESDSLVVVVVVIIIIIIIIKFHRKEPRTKFTMHYIISTSLTF